MFSIHDGRTEFYQWDKDRKIIVNDSSIKQVHFCNKTDDSSLVVDTYQEGELTLANVPNVLLQTDWKIRVYGYTGDYTKHEKTFKVNGRTKPADYIYTEVELWSAEKAVNDALAEAKASGDFKGEKGDKGEPGKDSVALNGTGAHSAILNRSGTASGHGATVEGLDNKAIGDASHAEGNVNEANANCSHVEGHGNYARGYASHAEGRVVEARGHSSHASGRGTITTGAQQMVIGTYNEYDIYKEDGKTKLELAPDGKPQYQYDNNNYVEIKSKNAFIIGNGKNDKNRSNALTVDWKGNVDAKGNINSNGDIYGNTGYFSSVQANLGLNAASFFLDDGSGRELCNYDYMIQAVDKLNANPVGHNIKVIKPNKVGSIVLQENTYYQFLGSSTKKKLHFYNSSNGIDKTLEFQVLTIYCGSMTDMAEIGIVENMSPAYLMVIGNDTGLSALAGAEVGTYAFKKYLPNSSEINPTFRAEVEYPAGSTIIIQTR